MKMRFMLSSVLFCNLLVVLFLGFIALLHPVSYADEKPKARDKQGPQIVKKILKVEGLVQQSDPPNLVLSATGQVPTGGYTKARLVRAVYVTPPEDGIQDYFLMAEPPDGIAAQIVSEVKARHTWRKYTKEAPWIKGIRVHGVDEGVVVQMFAKNKKNK